MLSSDTNEMSNGRRADLVESCCLTNNKEVDQPQVLGNGVIWDDLK